MEVNYFNLLYIARFDTYLRYNNIAYFIDNISLHLCF